MKLEGQRKIRLWSSSPWVSGLWIFVSGVEAPECQVCGSNPIISHSLHFTFFSLYTQQSIRVWSHPALGSILGVLGTTFGVWNLLDYARCLNFTGSCFSLRLWGSTPCPAGQGFESRTNLSGGCLAFTSKWSKIELFIYLKFSLFFQERPYHNDSTASRLLSEVKHCRARLVLRWGTTLESLVLFFCSGHVGFPAFVNISTSFD